MTDAGDWSGRVGDVWAAQWRATDLSFADLAPGLDKAILAAAKQGAGTAIDIGCGAGATAIALATARPDLRIVGVDLSSALLNVAAHRAEGIGNLRFVDDDIRTAAASLAPVDLFVSRHGVMFFDDPVAAFATLRAAAAPDARFVFSCFRPPAENAWVQQIGQAVEGASPQPRADAPGPFAFADPDRVRSILDEAGWKTDVPAAIDYRYRAGEGEQAVADAVAFLSRIGPAAARLRDASAGERDAAVARITGVVERHRVADAIDFPAAAWIWFARAA